MQVLASLLLNRAEKELIIVQKYCFLSSCKNIAIRLPCIAGFLCRAIFRGCAEIEIFGDIFTSVPTIMINHLDMVGEHVQLGVVQFRRLLFDFLQGGGLLACVCVMTGANDISSNLTHISDFHSE